MTSSGHAYVQRSALCSNKQHAVKCCGMDVVWESFGRGYSPYTGQGNDFELIPMVTRAQQ